MSDTKDFPHKKISRGIVRSFEQFWKDHEHGDFQVIIDGECIRCHSFLLASCSEFFRCLLRSNMREKLEMKVDLQNIPLNIFQLILKTLYTGCELLTKDNVLEVWAAVHQLQFDFLIQHCEDFVSKNISPDTLKTYTKHAKFLQSKKVSQNIDKYLLENFMTIRNRETFLQLDVKELSKLIESDELIVSSEDEVLYSVYDWVSYGDMTTAKDQEIDKSLTANNLLTNAIENNANTNSKFISTVNDDDSKKETASPFSNQTESCARTVHLLQLLKATRYCLISEGCLKNLFWSALTQSNTEVKTILYEASMFKLLGNMNRFWPTAAIHRDCSTLEHVGIVGGFTLEAFSFLRNKWLHVPDCGFRANVKFTTLKDQLYACCSDRDGAEVFHFLNNEWDIVTFSNTQVHLFLTHDKCLYMFSSGKKTVEIFQPHDPGGTTQQVHHSVPNVKYAMSFNNSILVFESVGKGDTSKARVHCWHVDKNCWKRLAELDCSAEHMTSFCDEHYAYILNKSGHLYRIEHSETIQFTFIKKIWDFQVELKGAVLFQTSLYVCGTCPGRDTYIPEVESIYSSLKFLDLIAPKSNFIPFLMPKTILK
uniref:BTB domain-containing protein n=1 Tax=Biomphalaria glabrata TaxID=6526 RepID=A0A2C9KSP9_BIOGL